MRTIILMMLFSVSGVVFAVAKDETKTNIVTVTTNGASTNAVSKEQSQPGALSAEEEKELKEIYSDEETGSTFTFRMLCMNGLATDKEKARYKHRKKLPFKAWCILYELKARAKAKEPVLKGFANVYLKDEKGEVVFSKQIPLKTILLMTQWDSGFIGEIEKEGIYTIGVWIKHRNALFGKVMKLKIAPAK